MSGIVGIHYLDERPVDRENLTKMVDILAHRGPDGADIWVDGCVGFGHRMLWTTPESLIEKLPLVNQRGDLVITADARIDNRDELIAALQINNRPADKITDSDLILAAYEKWGEDCPQHLLGDFAFAIWDERKQILFCARDHMGVKPFYYYFANNTFVFGSEIKAIFCLPEVPRQVNEVRIGDYLIKNFDDTTITSYQDILRLPPAHSIKISVAGIEIQNYWKLDLEKEIRLSSDEEYAQEFRRIFTEAVRCRLRSALPVGSLLSGGLDSSSITCVARNILAQEGKILDTFSAIFNSNTECDERTFINAVLDGGNLKPHYVDGDQRSPLSDIENILWHQDEVFFAPGLPIMNWGLYGATKKEGVRVLLDGHDGDGVVSHGYGYLHELARQGRWLALAEEIRGVSKTYNESAWKTFWLYFYNYGMNSVSRKPFRLVRRLRKSLQRRLSKTSNNSNQYEPLSRWSDNINPEFIERINLEERYRELRQSQTPSLESAKKEHYQTITSGLQVYALEVLDKAAAAFSIEQRYPFWDKRLVEFCLAIPSEQKLHKGWSRMVMRRAMTNILPVEVQWRTSKMDFTPNFSENLLARDKNCLEELIRDSTAIEEYVDIKALQELYQRLISEKDSQTSQDVFSIWQFVCLRLWLRSIA
ncbi:MAG: lasso peptide isopeptide bond-forming cyclase [Rivularia sp. (in: cyanobacteria)]